MQCGCCRHTPTPRRGEQKDRKAESDLAAVPAHPMASSVGDNLSLAANASVQKILQETKSTTEEKVLFSDMVTKINRKDKAQERVLLLTNMAM